MWLHSLTHLGKVYVHMHMLITCEVYHIGPNTKSTGILSNNTQMRLLQNRSFDRFSEFLKTCIDRYPTAKIPHSLKTHLAAHFLICLIFHAICQLRERERRLGHRDGLEESCSPSETRPNYYCLFLFLFYFFVKLVAECYILDGYVALLISSFGGLTP